MSAFSYVYVLVSKKGDTYYEQCLVSIMSLRHNMPNAHIVVVTDSVTNDTLTGNRYAIRKYASEIKNITISENYTNVQKSRYLKTKLVDYIPNDFLYLDSDTIITSSLEDIEQIPVDLGAILDCHMLLSRHPSENMILENAKKVGFHASFEDKHFNGGVMLVRKNSANLDFFNLWHKLWRESLKKGFSIDQLGLAEANFLSDGLIKELPGIWNCQVEHGTQFLSKAKILHMFVPGSFFDNRRPHLFMDSKTYKKIESEGISPLIMQAIENPLQYFVSKTQIIGGDAVDYYNTTLNRFMMRLYTTPKTRSFFNAMNWIAKVILRLWKRGKK